MPPTLDVENVSLLQGAPECGTDHNSAGIHVTKTIFIDELQIKQIYEGFWKTGEGFDDIVLACGVGALLMGDEIEQALVIKARCNQSIVVPLPQLLRKQLPSAQT